MVEDAWRTSERLAHQALSADALTRFHALVDEVTEELMRGGTGDRRVCRLDAITLLMAACERLRDEQPGESPLVYLLQEEQQKAAAALGQHPVNAPALAYMKV
ncbi:hypothetical protein [Caldimonas mangrovi]|nr:hypothetical protein [Caldimonas mangrovi]